MTCNTSKPFVLARLVGNTLQNLLMMSLSDTSLALTLVTFIVDVLDGIGRTEQEKKSNDFRNQSYIHNDGFSGFF